MSLQTAEALWKYFVIVDPEPQEPTDNTAKELDDDPMYIAECVCGLAVLLAVVGDVECRIALIPKEKDTSSYGAAT